METRTIAPSANVALVTSAPRVTPTPPRAVKFGEVLATTAVRSAEQAMKVLPGGPMMALAVRGGAASVPLGTSTSALTSTASPSITGKAPEGPTTGSSSASTLGGVTGSPGDPTSITSSLQESQDMNMYMLGVQQQVQQQNQQFTTLSNVMKAQHDTVKTAIGNIR